MDITRNLELKTYIMDKMYNTKPQLKTRGGGGGGGNLKRYIQHWAQSTEQRLKP